MQHLTAISSPKQATLQLVERLADDVTFEDIIYELYVLEKIQRGMKDAEERRVVSHEEAVLHSRQDLIKKLSRRQ